MTISQTRNMNDTFQINKSTPLYQKDDYVLDGSNLLTIPQHSGQMESLKLNNQFQVLSDQGFDPEQYKMEKILENFESIDKN